jgi:glyoxylase-like metal-dependent hydrolase (beta-lactamase superfamily II)
MDFLLEKVKDNLYVVAIWDAEWNTYNNCYLFLDKDGVTVIDSCKEEHSKHLLQALHKLGKTADDVKLLLAPPTPTKIMSKGPLCLKKRKNSSTLKKKEMD